jgi:hypothetical protein
MEKRMMSFEAFNTLKELNERYESFSEELAINEAFSSDYLRMLASQESGTRWRPSFAKDFYKFAGIQLDQITNEDFIVLSNPSEWWTQKYDRNDMAIGFFVDDNPEFIKALKEKGKMKNSQGIGVLLTIMRGNRGMWYGFAKDPGGSYSRSRKSPSERYGVLADEYDTKNAYGWDGGVKAKISRPNLEEVSTKVYVLDIDALKEKYSAGEITSNRAQAKAGAAAFLSSDMVKKANKARYEKILRDRLDPEQMFKDVQEAMSKYTTWLGAKVATMSLKDMKYDSNSSYFREEQVKWGSWSENLMRPISNMWDILNKFMERYYDFLRDQAHVERLQEKLASADPTEAAKIESEINYYAKSYDRFVKEATSYRDYVLKYTKDVDAIVSK